MKSVVITSLLWIILITSNFMGINSAIHIIAWVLSFLYGLSFFLLFVSLLMFKTLFGQIELQGADLTDSDFQDLYYQLSSNQRKTIMNLFDSFNLRQMTFSFVFILLCSYWLLFGNYVGPSILPIVFLIYSFMLLSWYVEYDNLIRKSQVLKRLFHK
jgi:hypothetical protein